LHGLRAIQGHSADAHANRAAALYGYANCYYDTSHARFCHTNNQANNHANRRADGHAQPGYDRLRRAARHDRS
jgi:hypothetical protein